MTETTAQRAAARQKAIITCAVTGSGLTPSMSDYLPITPEQIVAQSVDAVAAGAAIIHLHARDPQDGRPTGELEVWRQIVPELRRRTDCIVNMSCSLGPTAEKRLEAAMELRPDIATVIVGSMNYAKFKKAQDLGMTEFKYEWEREMLTGPDAWRLVTNNTFEKIGRMVETLIAEDIAIEFECYDVGHLYILDYHLKQHPGYRKPLIVQFLTGILGGIPSSPEHLMHLKQTTLNLFGSDTVIFTHGTGPNNMRAAALGALMGTNVRIGQEDNLTERPGVPFRSNAEQVEKIVGILDAFDIAPVSVAEARDRLGIAAPSAQFTAERPGRCRQGETREPCPTTEPTCGRCRSPAPASCNAAPPP